MTRYAALAGAHLRDFVRDRGTLFFTFAFPLVFIVVFGLIFGGETAPDGRRVINYIVPGVMSWGIGSSALFGVAYTTVNWRRSGVLRLVRSTPVSLPTVLTSRFTVTAGVGAVQTLVFLAVGSVPLLGVRLSVVGVLFALVALLLGVLTFATLGVLVGTWGKSPEGVAVIANCIMIPMAYLSGSFIPLYTWPSWLRSVSYVLPLRYLVSSITSVLADGTVTVTGFLVPCAVLVAFMAAFGLLALRLFKWEDPA